MSGIGVNIRVTGHCSQGTRRYMEDMFSVAYQQTQDLKELEYAFVGIFDGHGGPEAAMYAKEHLIDAIVAQNGFWSDDDESILTAIHDGYIQTHYAMYKIHESWPRTPSGLPSTSGTTATVAFIRKGKVYIGHVGDSALVLGYQQYGSDRWGAQPLTTDHKPESASEFERIHRSGGKVLRKSGVPRVVWNRPQIGHKGPVRRSTTIDEIPFLAVARALGDFWSYNSESNQFVVSPEPELNIWRVDPERDKCLILGTDGLWNVLSAQEAVSVVQNTEAHNEVQVTNRFAPYNENWRNPSKALVDTAMARWRSLCPRADNTSVVTILLDPPGMPNNRRAALNTVLNPERVGITLMKPQCRPDGGVAIFTRYPDKTTVRNSDMYATSAVGPSSSSASTSESEPVNASSHPPKISSGTSRSQQGTNFHIPVRRMTTTLIPTTTVAASATSSGRSSNVRNGETLSRRLEDIQINEVSSSNDDPATPSSSHSTPVSKRKISATYEENGDSTKRLRDSRKERRNAALETALDLSSASTSSIDEKETMLTECKRRKYTPDQKKTPSALNVDDQIKMRKEPFSMTLRSQRLVRTLRTRNVVLSSVTKSEGVVSINLTLEPKTPTIGSSVKHQIDAVNSQSAPITRRTATSTSCLAFDTTIRNNTPKSKKVTTAISTRSMRHRGSDRSASKSSMSVSGTVTESDDSLEIKLPMTPQLVNVLRHARRISTTAAVKNSANLASATTKSNSRSIRTRPGAAISKSTSLENLNKECSAMQTKRILRSADVRRSVSSDRKTI